MQRQGQALKSSLPQLQYQLGNKQPRRGPLCREDQCCLPDSLTGGARPKRQLLDGNALKVELRSPAPPLLAGLPSKADAQDKLKSPSQARIESKMHDSYNFSREILRKFPGLSTLDSPHLGITATHTRIYKAHLQGTARAKGIPAGNEVIRREKCKASSFAGDGERCHLGMDVCMYGCLYCTSEWHHPIPVWNPLRHVPALLIASILRE